MQKSPRTINVCWEDQESVFGIDIGNHKNKIIDDAKNTWTDFCSELYKVERGKKLPPRPVLRFVRAEGGAYYALERQKKDRLSLWQPFHQIPNTYNCSIVAMANMIHFMDNGGQVKARKFHQMMTDIHFDINWIEVFNRAEFIPQKSLQET